jgi:hypothetical protein
MRAAGISWQGVLVIHIIMGRGRPKCVPVLIEQNEQRERGMLPRAALHQENVISNEQLNRQHVEAGQIAPIFLVSTWSTIACAFVITHPYASLHICRFLCEVACLSVK